MLKGFYTAAAGMIAQQRRTDMLTNNLGNVNTPGFKAEQSSMRAFPEMLISRYESDTIPKHDGANLKGTTIGSLNSGVYMQETNPNLAQGDLQETNRPTDIALLEGNVPVDPTTGKRGSLFFTVMNKEGNIRYTKNGNFAIDGQGYLTTNEGLYVMGTNNQRIQIPSGEFQLLPDGTVLENGQTSARIKVAYASDPSQLLKEGQGLFKYGNNEDLPEATGQATYQLHQGYVERSNVDMQQTMSDLMIAYRAFESNQKILQAYDRTSEKACNEIGKL